jgi:hypothetical protein
MASPQFLNSECLSNHSYNKGFTTACYNPKERCDSKPSCVVVTQEGFTSDFISSGAKKLFSNEINSNIQQSWTWNKFEEKLESIRVRIKNCPEMGYAYVCCRDCSNIISEKPYKLTCGLRFCKNPECVNKRITKNKLRLHSYKIYSKKLIHFEVGFAYVDRLDKKEKHFQEKIIKIFVEEMKKLGTPVNALKIFDIAEHEGEYYLHHHFAQMPVKDYMQFVKNSQRARVRVIEKTGVPFVVHFEGWRPKKSLFSYFAKRMAGVYGDVGKQNKFMLADVISIREYARDFFNVRSFVLIGSFPSRRRGNVLLLALSSPKTCPFCGCEHFRLVPTESFKPPPPKLCPECGLIVDARDFCFNDNCCKYCKLQKSFSFKKSIELKNRLPELAQVNKQNYEGERIRFILSSIAS